MCTTGLVFIYRSYEFHGVFPQLYACLCIVSVLLLSTDRTDRWPQDRAVSVLPTPDSGRASTSMDVLEHWGELKRTM